MLAVSVQSKGWQELAHEAIVVEGCAILLDVVERSLRERVREALYKAREAILAEIGVERLQRAGEIGTLRLLMRFDDVFFRLLELPQILDVVDKLLGDTCILHTQNGFILPSFAKESQPDVFQNTYHRDFPRFLHGYRASVSALITFDDFTAENGATRVVPGTHLVGERPSQEYFERNSVAAECAAGSVVLFDAALYHAAGLNTSGKDRIGINHQFTRSWMKQQIDYVRALGDEKLSALPERTQQLLGWYTRVVTSLDEYYRPEAERLYRRNQG